MDSSVAAWAKDLGFNSKEELEGGHCSRVYADESRVLKVPFQGEELDSGYWATLQLADNVGPKVIGGLPERGAILMERILPGSRLLQSNLPDSEQLEIVLKFVRQIQPLSPERCLPLASYYSNPSPLAVRLIETTPKTVFLHGDLHQENILLGDKGWKLIDPKGLVGDPAFEPTAFLRNPISTLKFRSDLLELQSRRIQQFSHGLNLDPWRICAWSLVDLQDMNDPSWSPVMEVMELLEERYRSDSSPTNSP